MQAKQSLYQFVILRFPKIFSDPTVGEEARSLYDEAQSMLASITAESSLEARSDAKIDCGISQPLICDTTFQARAVVSFFPANSEGDDILVYADEDSDAPRDGRGSCICDVWLEIMLKTL